MAGLGVGFLAGLLGIGGGIIYILILPQALTYLQVPQQEIAQYIIANSIFGTAAAALAGNVALICRKEFQWQSVSIVGLGGGVIVIPIMTTKLGMNIKQTKSISLG